MPERSTNFSDAGSNAVKSETGDASEQQLDGAGGRRESWVHVNSTLSLPGHENDRRPSLPLPNSSRPMPSQSPYSLPSLQQHHPDGPLYTSSPPSLPSLSATTQSPSQYLTASSNRLQPINSWLPSRPSVPPPPYSQSLPPITATASPSAPVLPPPGSVTQLAPSPPLTSTEGPDTGILSTSLGGDDVLAFLDGGEWAQLSFNQPSEVGIPTGWLSAVWAQSNR